MSSALSRHVFYGGLRSPAKYPVVCPNNFPVRRTRKVCYVQRVQCCLSTKAGTRFELDDVIEAQQFDREILTNIFMVAREMEEIERGSKKSEMLRGHLMATLFYEPSTRTRLSFESAMKRLGGEVLTTENAREFSSAAKGETLEGRSLSPLFLSTFLNISISSHQSIDLSCSICLSLSIYLSVSCVYSLSLSLSPLPPLPLHLPPAPDMGPSIH